jgi:deoxyribodipyrimidine photo-lyase
VTGVQTCALPICLSRPEPDAPLAAPSELRKPRPWPKSCRLDELKLLPSIDWAKGLSQAWTPGSAGAQVVLARFLEQALVRYDRDRDRPAVLGTSRLSPYLHWGEISVREVWQAVGDVAGRGRDNRLRACAQVYRRELGWREFGYHLLVHFPRTPDKPLRPEFEKFPWRRPPNTLRAWQRGRTGYPIVDAGMHELWRTGWMHNRVRMIVASFLVKDLLLPWQQGAKWFWDTLVDADLANNTLGWQWSAGCGADAAPYFRVFNPASQGRKFDPDGDYVRKWIPSLRSMPSEHIHDLQKAERDRAEGYPDPIVDHAAARKRALTAFAAIRKRR